MENAKPRAMVADDDELLRGLAALILSGTYDVMQAVDGQDGWEKAPAFKPALAVIDLMMPRMHGYELCALLKGPDGIPGIKVIVTSSKSFPADKDLAMKAGADAYIVKPYDPDNLLVVAAKLLSGSASAGLDTYKKFLAENKKEFINSRTIKRRGRRLRPARLPWAASPERLLLPAWPRAGAGIDGTINLWLSIFRFKRPDGTVNHVAGWNIMRALKAGQTALETAKGFTAYINRRHQTVQG